MWYQSGSRPRQDPTHRQRDESVQISLTVTIDQDIVGSLEESRLQDILVMNLENGRDHFIPVTAKYCPKCFGVTLERLLQNKAKKTDLIDFVRFMIYRGEGVLLG